MTNARRKEAGRAAARMGSGGSSPSQGCGDEIPASLSAASARAGTTASVVGVYDQSGVYIDVLDGWLVKIWQMGKDRPLDPIFVNGPANLDRLIEGLQKAKASLDVDEPTVVTRRRQE